MIVDLPSHNYVRAPLGFITCFAVWPSHPPPRLVDCFGKFHLKRLLVVAGAFGIAGTFIFIATVRERFTS